jgi:hypothetical protein
MDIDFTSLFAGISLTAIAGWIGLFLGVRKDERAVHIKQITEERAKWRNNIRIYAAEAAEIYSGQEPVKSEIAKLRVKLVTSLSPKSNSDKKLIDKFDLLDSSVSLVVFTELVSLLLKHDWERVKWECTPIYIKPFIRFTKKQRAWRDEDVFRSSEEKANKSKLSDAA